MAIPELRAACLTLLLLVPSASARPQEVPPEGLGPVRWTSERRTIEPVLPEPRFELAAECAARRAALARALAPASGGGPTLVWLAARAADESDPFFQDDDFYYLSGVEIADIALLLLVGEDGSLQEERLYLPAQSDEWERWNGARLAPGPEAEVATGFARAVLLPGGGPPAGHGSPPAAATDAPAAWTAELESFGAAAVHALAPPPFPLPAGLTLAAAPEGGRLPLRAALDRLRLVKSPYEIACLTNAISITTAALRNALTEVRPGAYEYQAQGALEGTFLRLGAERPGFPSICGSGPNSVILHYSSNRRQMQDGDLLVMDVGAKYRYYCADVTRTVPVNGTFTPRQREIYEIVRAAQTAAAERARPGMTIKDLDTIAREVITQAGYGPYFRHSVGHWIGLDVHDVGGRVPLEIDSLFTIEPGIYLPEESLGVRIEDDYLMTPDGAVKLSVGVPSDPESLQALLSGAR